MTQSQLTHQEYLASLRFYSVTSICNWAGTINGVLFLEGDETLPYIELNGLYYYFGTNDKKEYKLVMISEKDISDNEG